MSAPSGPGAVVRRAEAVRRAVVVRRAAVVGRAAIVRRAARGAALAALAVLLSAGCGSSTDAPDAASGPPPPDAAPAPPDADPTAPLFDPGHVLDVAITLAPSDWDALRAQKNDPLALLGGDCLAGPKTTVFTWFRGAVTIDGQAFADVGVRKKGFLGSLSASKPSLKLKLDEFVPGLELAGLERLTLNNGRQDPSLVRTCLAFWTFARAGVPAPRCNFARVTVNGARLGVYAHVESADARLLRRLFGTADGDLYEAQLSDLRPGWTATFEKKNHASDPDRSELEALAAAVDRPDGELLAALEPLLDLDEFYRFWAAEALIGHWDGYASNLNNYFVYLDPSDGRFRFLPWGPDLSFGPPDPFSFEGDRPTSVSASAYLPYRLYALAPARYRDALLDLLERAWDEAALLDELDRLEALLGAEALLDDPAFVEALDGVRAFVRGRRAELLAELEAGPVPWPHAPRGSPCLVETGTVSGTFETTWGTLDAADPFGAGTGTLDVDIAGYCQDAGLVTGAGAGPEASRGLGRRQMIQVPAIFADGQVRAAAFLVAPEAFVPGDLAFDWQAVFGVVGGVDVETRAFTMGGLLNAGTLRLEQTGTGPGAVVSGSFTAATLGHP